MNTNTEPLINLLVAFHVADTEANHLIFPENNLIGAILLARLLNAKLEAAGELFRPGDCRGVLNHLLFRFAVRDVHASAEIVRTAALPEIPLNIFRYDESEGIYRRLFSTNFKDLQLTEVETAIAAVNVHESTILEKLLEMEAREQSQAGQQPPPPSTENLS